jgi:hypothetical protein
MRVRDPEDYSSVTLGVLFGVHTCYQSLDRGVIAQSNYQIEEL